MREITIIISSIIFLVGILSYPHSLPVKFKEHEKSQIDYDVPSLKQDCENYCWAACILMIRNYYYQESRYDQYDIASMVRPKLAEKTINCENPIALDEYKNALEYWGFEIYPPGCFLPEAWYDLLKEKGPLIVSLFLAKIITPREIKILEHAVVLKGMSDRSSNPTMYIIDPGTGEEAFVPYSLFEKRFEKIGEEVPHQFIIVSYFSGNY